MSPSGKPPPPRALEAFTVELDVYSGPYEGLLALILKEEIEIFEVPLSELVALYRNSNPSQEDEPQKDLRTLERDTDFADSATSLILLKGRALTPDPETDPDPDEASLTPEDLEERLVAYLKLKRAAEALKIRLEKNARLYPANHPLTPRPGRLRVRPDRLAGALRRAVARSREPKTSHLGPITVTVQELAALIRTSLARGPVSFEDLVRDMDRLRSAVTFAAALSLAAEGRLNLSQPEPFGPLTLEPKPRGPR